ncbi:hypothetical protein [Neobacillus sp. D3-1R]|uniref:hypothetical protein n=1 Tax=Neobacillus sp. D3-1R TaxID=3445778 RepID=UPI003FA0DC10
MDYKKLDSQMKSLNKILERAQNENAAEKKLKLKQLEDLVPGSSEYNRLSYEIADIGTISDGTKKTYYDVGKAVMREAYRQFGITKLKHLTPDKTKEIIEDKILRGESPQNIRKTIHALDYIQKHAVKTRVFKENHNIQFTNHTAMLDMLKEKNIIRRASDSHRYKATKEECEKVIGLMRRYNADLADIATYQLLTGFRVSESIRQTTDNVRLESNIHLSIGAKGGLNNVVHTNHHSEIEKEFISRLIENSEPDTNRIFHRQKDGIGNYKSDEQIRKAVTVLANRCANKLGIAGTNGETFSSHCFRGAFAHERMRHYARHYDHLDEIIMKKINEQPRLSKKYANFEKRIKEKCKEPSSREIQPYEKIQWLISTDLNHSRQDIVRFYISSVTIRNEIDRYK